MNRSLLWPVGAGWSLVRRSLKMCRGHKHNSIWALFQGRKGSIHAYLLYICQWTLKTGQKYENSRNYSWGATTKQNLTPNLAIQWWILTLWRREENACNLFPNITWQACMPFRNRDYFEISLKKRCRVISRLGHIGLWLQWRFQIIRSSCQGVSTFLDPNNRSGTRWCSWWCTWCCTWWCTWWCTW